MGTNARLTRLERELVQRRGHGAPRGIVALTLAEYERFTHTGELPPARDVAPDPPLVLTDIASGCPVVFLNMSINEV